MADRRYAIDLTRTAWQQRHGDITCYGTWVRNDDDQLRPCIVLIPTHAQHHERSTPCVVTLDAAWRWSEAMGDADHVARKAEEFAAALGLPETVRSVVMIASIIHDHLQDLVEMPPRPAGMDQVSIVGEGRIMTEDGRVRETEIVERH